MLAAVLQALLICHVNGPGTSAQAQPVVEKFLRQFETAAGLKSGVMEGTYSTQMPDCEKWFGEKKPVLAVADLATLLGRRTVWALEPVAHMGRAEAVRYVLLVKEGAFANLAALKGKTLMTPLAADLPFLSRVVLKNQVDAATHFVLKKTARELKGIREVALGKVDATLVEEASFKKLPELNLPVKLKVIYTSDALPGLTLSLVGKADKKFAAQIKSALPKLCKGAGVDLCKNFQVDDFVPAKPGLYDTLSKLYGNP